MLPKWEIVRVFRPDLAQPHDKFCICIDWDRRWFLYFNSNPPQFRKARDLAVSVSSFEVVCLRRESFVDTTFVVDDLPETELQAAIVDQDRRHGAVINVVRERIRLAVASHGALTEAQREAILNDAPPPPVEENAEEVE